MAIGNQVFTESQRQLLATMLNRIIPLEGQIPGAGDLGVTEFVEKVVSIKPQWRSLFLEGLAQVNIAAFQQEGREFLELSDSAKDSILQQIESSNPNFFEELVRQTFNGYYTNTRIFERIGYDKSRPYEPEQLDESLLELQRQRAPFWRQV